MFVFFLGIDCTVLDSFYLILLVVARLQLWLILMACLRHLVSALTNTDDIRKVAFRQTFVIEPVILANLMTFLKVGDFLLGVLDSSSPKPLLSSQLLWLT